MCDVVQAHVYKSVATPCGECDVVNMAPATITSQKIAWNPILGWVVLRTHVY